MRSITPRYMIVAAVLCLGVVLLMSLTSGCTTPQKKQPAREKSTDPYQLESEGEIPPLDESQMRKEVDRTETFEEMPVADDAIDVENVDPPPVVTVPGEPADPARKTMDGFRIQVFASGNKESAEVTKSDAEAKTGERAYVDLVDGIYKVRVGDCPSREEAEALLRRVRSAGYGDAWIVSCPVFMPAPESTP